MANQPKTPGRQVRIEDELWFPFLAKAKTEGTNASEKIRAYIARDLGVEER